MSDLSLTSFLADFAHLPDPRIARWRQYPLLEILFLCVSVSLSGYEEWDEIIDFGQAKLTWLRRYLPFPAGIPAHDTLNRVMSRLDARAFEKCLINWAQHRAAQRAELLFQTNLTDFGEPAPWLDALQAKLTAAFACIFERLNAGTNLAVRQRADGRPRFPTPA